MMERMTLVSLIVTRVAIAGGRRDLPPPQNPRDGDKGGVRARGRGELPYMLATMFATLDNVHAALRNYRPPDKPPNLPHCYANDLRVSHIYIKAMNSEFWGCGKTQSLVNFVDCLMRERLNRLSNQ